MQHLTALSFKGLKARARTLTSFTYMHESTCITRHVHYEQLGLHKLRVYNIETCRLPSLIASQNGLSQNNDVGLCDDDGYKSKNGSVRLAASTFRLWLIVSGIDR